MISFKPCDLVRNKQCPEAGIGKVLSVEPAGVRVLYDTWFKECTEDPNDLEIAEIPDIKTVIADEAKRIVSGARRSAYGKPEQNFERIAAMWSGYAKAKGWPIEFAAGDVSPMMILMKLARVVESPSHYDSWVDAVGYSLTGAEVNAVQPPAAA